MRMKKFINDPQNLVSELLEGMVLAFPDKVRLSSRNILARAVPKEPGKVRLVTLGGSGHEPGLSGFVGQGMLDLSVAGDIFAAPGAPRCMEAIRSACANGESALLIVLNHAGDVLSGNIAMEMALREGCRIKMILTHEDIAGGPNPDDRRGLVGFFPVYKVAGAAAERGAGLDACSGDCHPHGTKHALLSGRGQHCHSPLHRAANLRTGRRRDGDWHGSAWGSGNRPHAAQVRG